MNAAHLLRQHDLLRASAAQGERLANDPGARRPPSLGRRRAPTGAARAQEVGVVGSRVGGIHSHARPRGMSDGPRHHGSRRRRPSKVTDEAGDSLERVAPENPAQPAAAEPRGISSLVLWMVPAFHRRPCT